MEQIAKALSKIKGKMNSVDLQIYLSDMYDDNYHLYNHRLKVNDEFATVSLMEKEKILKDSVLERSVDRYLLSGLKQVYGISLSEYMDTPVDYMDVLVLSAEKEMKKRKIAMDDVEKDFGK